MPSPNPVLKKLGFADDDRVVILHMDDVGMCHANVKAYRQLLDFGLMSSAAVMVPCPWFPAAAAVCRDYPHADLGVHLTLNSEWDVFRWSPISTADTASGLIDDEGYYYNNTRFLFHASVDTPELRALAPDWQARVGDLRVFSSPDLRDFSSSRGFISSGIGNCAICCAAKIKFSNPCFCVLMFILPIGQG